MCPSEGVGRAVIVGQRVARVVVGYGCTVVRGELVAPVAVAVGVSLALGPPANARLAGNIATLKNPNHYFLNLQATIECSIVFLINASFSSSGPTLNSIK